MILAKNRAKFADMVGLVA